MSYNSNVVGADKQSIFGDTYSGVVSPWVPHVHPYPTRFHGPIYNYPVFGRPYRAQSFMVPGNYLNPNLSSGLGADVVLPDVVITGELEPWYKHPLFYGVLAASALGVGLFALAQMQSRRPARANKRRARRNAKRQPRCPVGTKVQSLVFDRAVYTPSKALDWAEKHGFKSTKIDEKPHTLRVRQESPSHFKARSFRVIPFGHGVQATIGCPR